MIALAIQVAQRPQRVSDGGQLLGRVLGHVERPEAAIARVPRQQLLFGHGEERAAQGREHAQTVVGPLDRGQRGAQRVDLFALVEGLAADEQVRQPPRFERVDVRPRDVVLEVEEAAEQQAHVAGPDRPPRRRSVIGAAGA